MSRCQGGVTGGKSSTIQEKLQVAMDVVERACHLCLSVGAFSSYFLECYSIRVLENCLSVRFNYVRFNICSVNRIALYHAGTTTSN